MRLKNRKVIYDLKKTPVLLKIRAWKCMLLNGEPGVKSARYAGSDKDFDQNITKLLNNLTGIENRSAQFKTVICLTINGKHNIFEGICKGIIIERKKRVWRFWI